MSSSSRLARQACDPCRRLKRKCTRELPCCSLCVRLEKRCVYPRRKRRPDDLDNAEDASTEDEAHYHPSSFPPLFLLDSGSFSKNDPDEVDPGMPVPSGVSDHISSDTIQWIYEAYDSQFHNSLPFLNLLRVKIEASRFDVQKSSSIALLLLCMKVVNTAPDEDQRPSSLPLYRTAKRFVNTIEGRGMLSLRLLQAHILIAFYEIGHGIFPDAYLSVGHAVRLAVMMGLHDRRNSAQFFKASIGTYALREEERRAWWSVFLLDRFVHIGTSGLPLSAPDPGPSILLPCCDILWRSGEAGACQPVLSTSFAPRHDIAPFASCCQAAHVLGRVLRHRDDYTNRSDPEYRLSEAMQLHKILVALSTDLEERHVNTEAEMNSSAVIAYALCCTARFLLYNMYGCNEPDAISAAQGRIAQETEMQQAALEGIKSIAMVKVAKLLQQMRLSNDKCFSPLLCYVVYHAASECAWFIKESGKAEMVESMRVYVELLRTMEQRWRVAGLYVKLLEHEGAIKTLDEVDKVFAPAKLFN